MRKKVAIRFSFVLARLQAFVCQVPRFWSEVVMTKSISIYFYPLSCFLIRWTFYAQSTLLFIISRFFLLFIAHLITTGIHIFGSSLIHLDDTQSISHYIIHFFMTSTALVYPIPLSGCFFPDSVLTPLKSFLPRTCITTSDYNPSIPNTRTTVDITNLETYLSPLTVSWRPGHPHQSPFKNTARHCT